VGVVRDPCNTQRQRRAYDGQERPRPRNHAERQIAVQRPFKLVGLLRIELRTSALSDQISFPHLNEEYTLRIPPMHDIDIYTTKSAWVKYHSGHIPARLWTASRRPIVPAFRDKTTCMTSQRDPARDTARPFWTTAEHKSAIGLAEKVLLEVVAQVPGTFPPGRNSRGV
jgi:hypothetical protein